MSEFVTVLDQEITVLEQELRADPRRVRLEMLKEVRRLYTTPMAASVRPDKASDSQSLPPTPTKSNDRGNILATAADTSTATPTATATTTPTPTAESLPEIEAQGLVVHGKEPRNTLSAMLSNAKEFKTHGRLGWTLVESTQPVKNTEAADGDTPSNDPSAASSRAQPNQPGNPTPLWS